MLTEIIERVRQRHSAVSVDTYDDTCPDGSLLKLWRFSVVPDNWDPTDQENRERGYVEITGNGKPPFEVRDTFSNCLYHYQDEAQAAYVVSEILTLLKETCYNYQPVHRAMMAEAFHKLVFKYPVVEIRGTNDQNNTAVWCCRNGRAFSIYSVSIHDLRCDFYELTDNKVPTEPADTMTQRSIDLALFCGDRWLDHRNISTGDLEP